MAEVTEIARARVAKLLDDWDWPQPTTLEEILALGDEAVPALAEVLIPERMAKAQEDDDVNTLVYYCIHLLGDLKRPAAIPVLTALYAQIAENDDILTETVTDALHRIGPAAIAALLTVVADDTLPYYPRMQACETVVDLAGRDLLRRAQIAAALRPLLAEYVARPGVLSEDDRTVVAVLVSTLAKIADLSARPLIQAAFDAGRVGGELRMAEGLPDLLFTTPEDIAETFEQGGETEFRAAIPFLDGYRQDYQRHLAEPPRPSPPPDPPMRSRLGRNDPCWCGSGQKYKKCHLAEDEKNKVRL